MKGSVEFTDTDRVECSTHGEIMKFIHAGAFGLLKTPHFLRFRLPGLTLRRWRAQSRPAGRKSRIGIPHILL